MKPVTRNPVSLLPLLAGLALPQLSHALVLDFSSKIEAQAAESSALTSYNLPIGPFDGSAIATRAVEGAFVQQAYRLDAPGLTTLQLLQPLRDQMAKQGYKVIYECETAGCGGFDFRYGTDVLPEPDMHVDLGDFRYLAAERAGLNGPEVVSLIVSRSSSAGFVQLVRVSADAEAAVVASTKSPDAGSGKPVVLNKQVVQGAAPQVLEDLVFASGEGALTAGTYQSLQDLADWMRQNPDQNVTLHGHTDSSGAAAANLALSQARADAVRQTLITAYKIDPSRIVALGLGDTAPRASNDSKEGRAKNRRVEVLTTSTQVSP